MGGSVGNIARVALPVAGGAALAAYAPELLAAIGAGGATATAAPNLLMGGAGAAGMSEAAPGAANLPLTLAGAGPTPVMSSLGTQPAAGGGFPWGITGRDMVMPTAMLVSQGIGAMNQPGQAMPQPAPRVQVPSIGNQQALPQSGINPVSYQGGGAGGAGQFNPQQLMALLQGLRGF